MNLGKLTEEELERKIADGSLKAALKAEAEKKGEKFDEADYRHALEAFGYGDLDKPEGQ